MAGNFFIGAAPANASHRIFSLCTIILCITVTHPPAASTTSTLSVVSSPVFRSFSANNSTAMGNKPWKHTQSNDLTTSGVLLNVLIHGSTSRQPDFVRFIVIHDIQPILYCSGSTARLHLELSLPVTGFCSFDGIQSTGVIIIVHDVCVDGMPLCPIFLKGLKNIFTSSPVCQKGIACSQSLLKYTFQVARLLLWILITIIYCSIILFTSSTATWRETLASFPSFPEHYLL